MTHDHGVAVFNLTLTFMAHYICLQRKTRKLPRVQKRNKKKKKTEQLSRLGYCPCTVFTGLYGNGRQPDQQSSVVNSSRLVSTSWEGFRGTSHWCILCLFRNTIAWHLVPNQGQVKDTFQKQERKKILPNQCIKNYCGGNTTSQEQK